MSTYHRLASTLRRFSTRKAALAVVGLAVAGAVPATASASNPTYLGSKCQITAGLPAWNRAHTGINGPTELDCTGPATIGWYGDGVWLQARNSNGVFVEIPGSASGPIGPLYNAQAVRNWSATVYAAQTVGQTIRTATAAYANGNYGQAQGTPVSYAASWSSPETP